MSKISGKINKKSQLKNNQKQNSNQKSKSLRIIEKNRNLAQKFSKNSSFGQKSSLNFGQKWKYLSKIEILCQQTSKIVKENLVKILVKYNTHCKKI